MIFEFACYNEKCDKYKQRVDFHCDKYSEVEAYKGKCSSCQQPLNRVFSSFSFKGFGDDKRKEANN